jgi:hypothetical protein
MALKIHSQLSTQEKEDIKNLCLSKTKIDLGCGPDYRGPDCLHLDIRYQNNVDLIADLKEQLTYSILPNNHFEEVYAYDVLEHFSFDLTVPLLKSWIKLVKPNGKIIIRVPDVMYIWEKIKNGTLPFFEGQRLIFGGQTNPYDYHCAGFHPEYLEGLLLSAGCKEIVQKIMGKNEQPESHNITLVAIKK